MRSDYGVMAANLVHIDEHLESTIYAAGAAGFVPVTGEFLCTPEAKSDVAVLRLEGGLNDELAGQVFLSEADILPADQYDGVNYLTLVGYPVSVSCRSKAKSSGGRSSGNGTGTARPA
jgi:hypothetical protein